MLVPSRAFLRIGRLPSALQVPAAALGGFAFPVCECGSVPVARRLVSKGLRPGAAVTFMLAAPILNPVVLLSTLVAYRGRSSMWFMVGGRFLLGLIVAVTVGWVVGEASAAELLLRRQEDRQGSGGGHAGEHDTRRQRFSEHLSGDFLFMGRFLVFGALVAAAFQTFVPQGWVDSVAGIPVLSVLAMMGLAFLLSLCSESDAFVAASFVQFGPSSQLAFLVFGPMMDTKLTALYAGTFRRGLVGVIAITAATVTLVGSLWLEVLSG
ncbi:MAG: permease [Dehalococcoidia bacterium]